MKTMITMAFMAGWMSAIALIAIQNVQSVSLRFLIFQSVQLPFGLALAWSVAVGMIGMALFLWIWPKLGNSRSRDPIFEQFYEDDPEPRRDR